jgi:hypothetical protein
VVAQFSSRNGVAEATDINPHRIYGKQMTSNYALLRIANDRLTFWQHQLQAAFREGNVERAAACQTVISEYAIFTNEALNEIHAE